MKIIKLFNREDKVVIVDDEDFDYLNQYRWDYISLYAARLIKKNGKRTYLYMHREIMGVADKGREIEVDHIDKENVKDYGLDNRKENLRVCTHAENQRNSKLRSDNVTGYKGVCWYPKLNKWRSYIQYNNKTMGIGYHDSAEEAARAYDKKAKELFGEFARLNFPEEL